MKKLFLLLFVCFAFLSAHTQIIINELESDAGNNDGTGGDWIELKNIGATPQDMSCWRLSNGGSVTISIPNGLVLPAGAYLLIGSSSKMMCSSCDYKSLSPFFPVLTNGFGNGGASTVYSNTIFLNTDAVATGGCGCLSGSGDYNNGNNTGDRIVLFDDVSSIQEVFMFAGGNKYGPGAINANFVSTPTCAPPTTPFTIPSVADPIYVGKTICNDLSGCNSSYARLPDGNNGSVITWDQSGNLGCTNCLLSCSSGAGNTASTDFPTPGLSNNNSANTWSAIINGSPVTATVTNMSVCGAVPITFQYTVNGFTNVALTNTQSSGNLGSYVTTNGGAPVNFTTATYNGTTGTTTLSTTFTPGSGVTTYEFVWADGNTNCTTCPGTTSTTVPASPLSPDQECYVYRKLIVSRENPLGGTPIASCSIPGTILISGATGTNLQYTLQKQSVASGPFLTIGGPFASNIIGNIVDDDADPALPNYQVLVSTANLSCANPTPLVASVPNSCLGNPACPVYVTSGTGAPTFTPASGATVCRNTPVNFSVDIKGVCTTGQVEVLYDYNPSFDPYTSGTSLGLAGTTVGTAPPIIPSSGASGKVFINEFAPRPAVGSCTALGITPNGASPNSGEWIELYCALGNVDISGWAVSDGDWTCTIPSGVIMTPGSYYLIGGGGTLCSSGVLPDLNIETCNCATVSPASQDIMNLTDGNEQIALYDCSGNFIDGVLWGVGQGLPDTTANIAPISGCGNYIPSKSVSLPAAAAFAASGGGFSGTQQGRYRSSTNTWVTTNLSATPAVPITPKAMNPGGNWTGTGTGSIVFGAQAPPPPVHSTLNVTLPDTCTQTGSTSITLKAIYRPDPTSPCLKSDVTASATYTIPSCELLTLSGGGDYCVPNTAPISVSTSIPLSGNYTINLSNGTNTQSITPVTGAGPFTTNITNSGTWIIANTTAPSGVCPPKPTGSAVINIAPIPHIINAPSTASFCNDSYFDLTSVQPSIVTSPITNTYFWYDSLTGGTLISTYVNPAATTTYYVVPATSAPTFCEDAVRTPITLVVNPVPDIPTVNCVGDTVTFIPTNPDCIPTPCASGIEYSLNGLNWSSGPSFTPSSPGWSGFGSPTNSLVYFRNISSPSCYTYSTFFSPCFFPLPTQLFHFIGLLNKDHTVHLQWQTTQEKNVSHFEVERSADKLSFAKIGEVKANGNTASISDYSFNDISPLNGSDYYRLKIVDEDGQYVYSNIILINTGITATQIAALYPNPANDFLMIEINAVKNEKTNIQVVNTLGQQVMALPIVLQRGSNTQQVNIQSLAKGNYTLRIFTGNEVMIKKFVKE